MENEQCGPCSLKSGRSEVRNYRPVSLLPVLSKVLETVLASRMTEHLERHHLLCTRHFVFRQGRSAVDLHLLLTSELSATLDQGKDTAVVALDMEGAFDRVWQAALITKLHLACIDQSLLPLIICYYISCKIECNCLMRQSCYSFSLSSSI